jgi:hypothetical protein
MTRDTTNHIEDLIQVIGVTVIMINLTAITTGTSMMTEATNLTKKNLVEGDQFQGITTRKTGLNPNPKTNIELMTIRLKAIQ